MRVQKPYSTLRLLGAVLLPLCAAGLQLLLLAKLPPLTWLFFYPAVFLSAWLGGLAGGLIAAGLSALLSVYIFMPPYWSWQIADMRNAYSAGIFLFMGGLFSVVFERLHRSTAELLRIKALELEINQNRLNQALHAASAGIWEWDLNNNQNYWDESLWQLYGLQPFSCQASYDLWLTTVHPDDGPAAQEAIRQAVKKNLELKLEWRLAQLFDGKERWLMSRGQPEFDANGQPTLYRGIVIDISDRKCAEAHLQDQEQWLSFALGSLQAGVWELKLDTLVARRTLKHDQIFGYAQLLPEWSYELFLEHVIAEDRDSVDRLFRMANAEQSNWSFDCRIRRADGEIRWIWASGQHKFDACGQAVSLVGIMQDITERKQVEDALQQQERLLADSQAVAHIGSWAVNLTNGRISWSEETYRLHGLSPKTDKPPPADQFAELLHVEDRPRLRTWIDGLKTGNQENGLEFRTREINGINRWLLAFAKTDRDKQGTPIRIIGTVQDISDRKRLLADLQRWADAFRYCAHGIVIGNPDTGLIITCNPAFAALLGFSGTEEAEGFPILSLYPPEKLDQIKAHIKQADQFGSCRYESVYERRNGSKTDVQVDLVSVKDATDGKVIYRVATLQDISARKRFEETLRLQSRALEAAANAIIISTADGVIEWVNPAYTAMTGFKDIEVVGKRPEQLATLEAQNQEDYRAQWQNIHNGSVWHGEMINYRKDGSLFAEELSITPVFNEQGDIEHVISIKQDITERKRQQAELMEYRDHLENLVDERTRQLSLAREEAERLSQVKSRFLANMSHEIRTPMNAVLGFCYLLQQRSLDADTLELVRKIHSAGRSLLAIINDILDFSKIEAGKLEIEMVPFQLSEVLDHLAALMSSSANNKNLELIISPAFDADELIGDGLRLQQVLVNLISNAIKFTEQGEVELKVSIDSETDHQLQLRFTVRDT
ncbi:MAG: PAS domain S-box protein, partial [Methylococcales bacterium]